MLAASGFTRRVFYTIVVVMVLVMAAQVALFDTEKSRKLPTAAVLVDTDAQRGHAKVIMSLALFYITLQPLLHPSSRTAAIMWNGEGIIAF